ncbi:MAG: hypothetical protein ACKPHU_17335, partial [Planctomycetaceae bacterium]
EWVRTIQIETGTKPDKMLAETGFKLNWQRIRKVHGMQEVIGSTPLSSTQPHQAFLMRFFIG